MERASYNSFFTVRYYSVIRFLGALFVLFFFQACAVFFSKPENVKGVSVELDLRKVENDQLSVKVDPLTSFEGEVIFYLPKIIPGTYEISDFGRFVSNLVAYDYNDKKLYVEQLTTNSWRIPNGKKLNSLIYNVDDSFDGNIGSDIYPMGGTKIERDSVFLLNLHGFIGYFEGGKEWPYQLQIESPAYLKPYTAMEVQLNSPTKDIFNANRYFNIIDEPILYTAENSISFKLDGIQVNLAVHSPNDVYKASDFEETLINMMQAQKRFLGPANATKSYDVLLLFMNEEELNHFKGMQGALEHHKSTTVTFYEDIELESMKEYIMDVVSHEFFHTLTPLNIHSEQVHDFNYNEGIMSKHLWMYEGTTEYFSHLFQVQQGLISENEFYDRMLEKIDVSYRYDDKMSFTEMSQNIVNEPYKTNYLNVYQKGALINMCLDILIREITKGKRGVLSIMQQLAEKYGVDTPFVDDQLFDEIKNRSSILVGQFFEKHVSGISPINYDSFFKKVGLHITKEEKTDLSIILLEGQVPFVAITRAETGNEQLVVQGLNSSLDSLGFQVGDVIKNFNGTVLPEKLSDNLPLLNQLLDESLGWQNEQAVAFEIERNKAPLKLSGKVIPITNSVTVLRSIENPNSRQLELRNSWLQINP